MSLPGGECGRIAGVVRYLVQRLLLLMTAVGVIGLLGSAWISRRAPAPTERTAAAAGRVPAERIVRFEAVDEPAATTVVADAPVSSRVEQLSASESIQFAALCDLHLLAADADLDLTTKQWSVFAEIVVHTQAVRHTYEARIATAREIEPGRYRVEIPAYAAAGDELRRQFLAEMQSGLGREGAAEVMEKLGRQLEGRFAGFGVSAQTLEITGDPARAPADLLVESTAHYWDSIDGRERVTTRRETHFPLAGNPADESWHALLALVGKTG